MATMRTNPSFKGGGHYSVLVNHCHVRMWAQHFQPSNFSTEVKHSGFYVKSHTFEMLATGFIFFYKNLEVSVSQNQVAGLQKSTTGVKEGAWPL